ncbi:MAG TPA: D-alanyl-D-alanine carboxypeptidase family protein [Patescibacteria group bacterium]|nr:D-alanyl-D-alanine carboxypeptidase family protein [Patescibacteria group bacterium]
MKKLILFTAFLLVIAVGAILPRYVLFKDKSVAGNQSIASPLPKILTKTFPGILGAEAESEYWKPNIDSVLDNGTKKPNLSAEAAIAYDVTTNTLLYERNIKTRLPIASLTKIMTATIALETMKLNDVLTVSKSAAEIGEDSMGLKEGDKLTLEDLLFGLVLKSGNDAGEVIAQDSPLGRDNFVYTMNKKAEDLGLTNTHFTNPTGLEGDGKQYSSAVDLLVMTRYALLDPDFTRIAATVEYEIPQTSDHSYYYLSNETNLLTSYPGVKGVKTGYTPEAGLCLVTFLDFKGHKIIAVLLNAQNRRQEMKDLLDYSLKTEGMVPPPHQ